MKQYTYAELAKIGQKYYQDRNFCSVIALAVCCNQSFGKVYHTMRRLGRETTKGVRRHTIYDALDTLGHTSEIIDGLYNKQVKSLHKYLPQKGVFMIHVRGHVLSYRDGKIEDWTDGRSFRILEVRAIKPKL